MRRSALVLLSLLATLPALAQDSRDLPLDHWAYPYLERWEAKGWIALPANKPYTRQQVLDAIMPLRAVDTTLAPVETEYGHSQGVVMEVMRVPGGHATNSDQWQFFTLLMELRSDHMRGVQESDLVSYRQRVVDEPDLGFGLDAALTPRAAASRGVEPAYSARGDFDAWGRWRATPTQEFLFDQRLVFTAEEEQAKYQRLDATTQSWRGGTFDIDYSYFRYANPFLSVTAGRQQRWWGQGTYGTLLLSTNAQAFDALSFQARYRRLGFEWFAGIMSIDHLRFYSGHRATIRLPWHVTAGFSETVLYRASYVDPVYANPLLPYYGTQWNERDDDNIMWALDARWTPGHGVRLYGELLMDDVQYEQDPPAPQKMGFLLGGHWADPFRLPDTDLRAEWAGVQKWTYTHRQQYNRYVGADTASVIGHWIGTDADALDLMLEHRFHPR
ncbi:hypothetical protein EG831_04495, partial [bacterium]|nr:hypothetical protein [bacterium]